MSPRALWPALIAVVALLALYFAVGRHDEGGAASAPTKISQPAPATAPPAPAAVLAPPAPAGDQADPQATKPPLPADIHPTEGPPAVPKKPKLTLDEKLAETQTHVEVMEKRAAILDKEIEALEREGKKQEAAEQRILVKRLRAHMDELRKAIAEKREPQ